ncbi:MAG: N-acetylmuramoyl-L-alanine amidase, partial [Marinoscillum sp.]
LLRNQKTFAFNRYFLLGALLMSVALPFLEIPLAVEASSQMMEFSTYQTVIDEVTLKHPDETPVQSINRELPWSWSQLLYGIYIVGVLIMVARFMRSLVFLFQIRHSSECIRESGSAIIINPSIAQPFSFFRWMYFRNHEQRLDQDLYNHELAHTSNWHSVDIMLIELIMILLWFHPIIYLYRSSIALNHEYIADSQVVNGSKSTASYFQKMLSIAYQPMQLTLVSNFSFVSLKNRLVMIKKPKSSKQAKFPRISIALGVALLLVGMFAFSFTPAIPEPNKEFVVIIDAGHGGEDPGTSTDHGIEEKLIVANISQKVRDKLSTSKNIKVILTRDGDDYLKLSERVANTESADLFLSLHVESHQQKDQKSALAIYYDRNDLSVKAKNIAQITSNEMQNCGKDCKVGYSDYFVLVNSKCPAVMLNVGYLSNEEDAAYLSSDVGQDEIAEQVARAIKIAAIE